MLRRYQDELLIILIGSLLFIPFLGAAHLFDWDEINFAEAAREMIVSGNYLQVQINFQPFWEKPPLFFWMQVLSMKVFGINEFAARFPNAVCGILSLLVIFRIGKTIKDRRFGWLWVLCFGGSLLPMAYFKSGIIDPWFNLFIFISLYRFILYTKENFNIRQLLWSGIFAGLAVLTKGPASLIVLGLCFFIYYLLRRFRSFIPIRHIFYYVGFILMVLVPWLTVEIIQNGTWFIWEFTKYQFQLASTGVAGHEQFLAYHFVVVFFFCLPASIFAIPSIYKKLNDDDTFNSFRQWMLILFWVVIILFTIIQTKIPHYSSLTYLPLSFLAATTIYNLKERWNKWFSIGLVVCFLPLIILLTALPQIAAQPELISKMVSDPAALSLFTERQSPFSGAESVIGICLLLTIIVCLILNNGKRARHAALFLFLATAVFINFAILYFTPRAEYYSQRSMIEFLNAHKSEDAYFTVTGFKSYAHLYYGEVKAEDTHNEEFIGWLDRRRAQQNQPADWPAPGEFQLQFNLWLLYGRIDKPAYFIIRSTAIENMLEHYSELKLVSDEGGYAVLRREVPAAI